MCCVKPCFLILGEKEASVLLRRVKAPPHRRNRVKSNPDALEPIAEPLKSPEEVVGRMTRSSQRCSAEGKELDVDAVRKPQRPRKQARFNKSRQAVVSSPESPPVKILQQLSSDDESSNMGKKLEKGGRSKNSRNKASHSNHKSSSSKSSESFEEQKGDKGHSAQKSQKQRSHGTRRPLERATARKRTVINPLESLSSVNDEISQQLSSADELLTRRKKRGKGVNRSARGKSRPKRASSSSESEDSDDSTRRKQKHKSSKSAKAPTEPEPAQPSQKHDTKKGTRRHEHDEDQWTEAELARLQE